MPASHAAPLRFTLLGPPQGHVGDRPLSLGSPQQQAVLARLLLACGRPVSSENLVDAVWGSEPPHAAAAVVRTYVSRLRGLLEPREAGRTRPTVLVKEPDGYALRIPEDALDVTVAEERLSRASESAARGDTGTAGTLMRSALELWQGVPLAGVPGPFAEFERLRLTEVRVNALETSLGLDLALGRHLDVVPQLMALTATHPLREELRRLLMVALYRSDRQAEALAVFHDARATLRSELGVEPGPGLRETHALMLAADPSLAAPVTGPRPPGRGPSASLPAPEDGFVGRAEQIERMTRVLGEESPAAAPVVALTGMGGVGKSALALETAHRLGERYPDGRLYADLRGAGDTPADPARVLAVFLAALGVPPEAVPEGEQERAALFRSRLAGRRVLVVLDDARDADQVRPLLPGERHCATLVTSRAALGALACTERVRLGPLPLPDAVRFFTGLLGRPVSAADRLPLIQVVETCGALPGVLRVVAGHFTAHSSCTAAELWRWIRDKRDRALSSTDGSASISECLGLGDMCPDEERTRAFGLLSLSAMGTLDLSDVAALLGTGERQAEETVEDLVDVHLLYSPTRHRYGYQGVVRLLAHECAVRSEEPRVLAAALARLLASVTAAAEDAHRVLRPASTWPSAPAGPPDPRFATEEEAVRWGRERLPAALRLAGQLAGTDPAGAVRLLLLLEPFLADYHDSCAALPAVDEVLRGTASAAGPVAGGALFVKAVLLTRLGAPGARPVLDQALERAGQAPDGALYARALVLDAWQRAEAGEHRAATAAARRAVAAAARTGDADAEARARGAVVLSLLAAGERGDSVLEAAYRVEHAMRASGGAHGLAEALCLLGRVLRTLGRPAEALRAHLDGLDLLASFGPSRARARHLLGVARTRLDLRRPCEAAPDAESAVLLARRLGDRRLEAEAGEVLADALDAAGHTAWADACRDRAQDVRRLPPPVTSAPTDVTAPGAAPRVAGGNPGR